MYAWPFDADEISSCDDIFSSDDAGFAVNEDGRGFRRLADYGQVLEAYKAVIGDQSILESFTPGFWLVSVDTDRAARKVPLGDTDAMTLRYNGIRKNILSAGAIKTLLPEALTEGR